MNDIHTLIKLQEVDSQLLEISELLGDLPSKVEELTSEESRLKEDIDERKERIKEIQTLVIQLIHQTHHQKYKELEYILKV